jgi:prepilin peptidase CpaA
MNQFIYVLIMSELALVAWIDLKTQKISNLWLPFNLIMTLVLYLLLPALYPFTWEIFVFPVGWIVIGFILFLLNIMGAGDSKFLASLFLLIPLEQQLPFLGKLVLATMAVGMILLSGRVIKNFSQIRFFVLTKQWEGITKIIRSRFSYAPVMFLAWLLFGGELWF